MKIIKTKKFSETASLAIDEDKKITDENILRQAIIAELDATTLYQQMADSTTNAELKKILLDVKSEEIIHIGEFEELLKKIDPEYKEKLEEGKEEQKNL